MTSDFPSIYNILPLPEDYQPVLIGDLRAYIHNMLIQALEDKAEFFHKPAEALKSIQEEAYLVARIRLLTELLSHGE